MWLSTLSQWTIWWRHRANYVFILPEKTSYYYKNLRFKKENNIMQLKFTMFVIFDICENAQSKEKKNEYTGNKIHLSNGLLATW